MLLFNLKYVVAITMSKEKSSVSENHTNILVCAKMCYWQEGETNNININLIRNMNSYSKREEQIHVNQCDVQSKTLLLLPPHPSSSHSPAFGWYIFDFYNFDKNPRITPITASRPLATGLVGTAIESAHVAVTPKKAAQPVANFALPASTLLRKAASSNLPLLFQSLINSSHLVRSAKDPPPAKATNTVSAAACPVGDFLAMADTALSA